MVKAFVDSANLSPASRSFATEADGSSLRCRVSTHLERRLLGIRPTAQSRRPRESAPEDYRDESVGPGLTPPAAFHSPRPCGGFPALSIQPVDSQFRGKSRRSIPDPFPGARRRRSVPNRPRSPFVVRSSVLVPPASLCEAIRRVDAGRLRCSCMRNAVLLGGWRARNGAPQSRAATADHGH